MEENKKTVKVGFKKFIGITLFIVAALVIITLVVVVNFMDRDIKQIANAKEDSVVVVSKIKPLILQEESISIEQTLEKDGAKLSLISLFADNNFVTVKFSLTLDEGAKSKVGSRFEFFTNSFHEISSSFRNIIIDGKTITVRGRQNTEIEQVSEYEYIIYETYYLSENELKGKEKFVLTYGNVKLINGSAKIEFNGSFDVEITRKELVAENDIETEVISKFDKITLILQGVSVTPQKTVVKVLFKQPGSSSDGWNTTEEPLDNGGRYPTLSEYSIISSVVKDGYSNIEYKQLTISEKVLVNGEVFTEWVPGDFEGNAQGWTDGTIVKEIYFIFDTSEYNDKFVFMPVICYNMKSAFDQRFETFDKEFIIDLEKNEISARDVNTSVKVGP